MTKSTMRSFGTIVTVFTLFYFLVLVLVFLVHRRRRRRCTNTHTNIGTVVGVRVDRVIIKQDPLLLLLLWFVWLR